MIGLLLHKNTTNIMEVIQEGVFQIVALISVGGDTGRGFAVVCVFTNFAVVCVFTNHLPLRQFEIHSLRMKNE